MSTSTSTRDKYRKGSRNPDDQSDKEFYTCDEVTEGDPFATDTTLLTSITGD